MYHLFHFILPPSSFILSLGLRTMFFMVVPGLQVLAFGPFFLAVFFLWRARRSAWHRGMVRNEFLALITTYGALVGTLLVLYALPRLGWMARYGVPPATPKDPALYYPQPLPIVVLALTLAGLSYAGRAIRPYLGSRRLPQSYPLSRTVNLLALAALVLLGLYLDGYRATRFLLPPAYLWLAAPAPDRRLGRWGRIGLILLAGLPFYAWLISYARLIQPDGYILGSVLMATAYGLFTPADALLALGFVAVGWRLLCIGHRRGD